MQHHSIHKNQSETGGAGAWPRPQFMADPDGRCDAAQEVK